MQARLSGSQFFDQHHDPIDRELIRDRRRYSFVMLNFFIELDALVAHEGNSASKGDQPKRSTLVCADRHCQTPLRSPQDERAWAVFLDSANGHVC
jgi:hypothetical protein